MYSEAFMLSMASTFNWCWADTIQPLTDTEEKTIDDDFMMFCMGGEL